MRRALLLPFLAAAVATAFAACGGDDDGGAGGGGDAGVDGTTSSSSSSSGSADGGGDGAIPPTPAPFGLDARPANPTCVAKPRPPNGGDVDLLDFYANAPPLVYPLHATKAPGDATKIYVSEQDPGDGSAAIKRRANDPATTTSDVFLQIPAGTVKRGVAQEGGLLSLAFDPGWAANRTAYVAFTIDPPGPSTMATVIARLKSTDGGNTLSWSTRQDVITIEKPDENHNGGLLLFGPDGNLYFGMGDGGGGNDIYGNGQRLDTMMGKMLRVTMPPTGAYTIPADNPFKAGGGAPEIFALGFRNPWRFSFDRETGDLWVGDVGESTWEEIDLVRRGGNYGWGIMEGNHCLGGGDTCDKSGLTSPVFEYKHVGQTGVAGGYVYRGSQIPALYGKYVFAEMYDSTIYVLESDPATGAYARRPIFQGAGLYVVSFMEDEQGELFAVDILGHLWKLLPKSAAPPSTFPTKLSQTGCFDPADPKKPAPGLVPFAPVAPLWSDGADKRRWLAVPDGKTIGVNADGDFDFPNGTVLAKEFSLGGKRVETRLFVRHDDGGWGGYSYEWNDAETEATLLPQEGKSKAVAGQTWTYPSRGQCFGCHTEAAGRSLGPESLQLNSDFVYTATNRISNQLATLDHVGLFTAPIGDPKTKPKLSDPAGGDPVDARARSYLHANCSHCHRPTGPGLGPANFLFGAADPGVCDVDPSQGTLGVAGAKLLAPGHPEKSIIPTRMKLTDARRMPALGTRVVDAKGVALLEAYITAKTTCP